VAVIAPLGAFYLESGIDTASMLSPEGGEGDEKEDSPGGIQTGTRHLVRREAGDELVIYSSPSSARLEWQQTGGLLASWVRIHPVFGGAGGGGSGGGGGEETGVTPVLMLTACPYKQKAIYLDSQPFQVSSFDWVNSTDARHTVLALSPFFGACAGAKK